MDADVDASCQETLEFGFEVLLEWLGSIWELQDFHRTLPWRNVLASQEGHWPQFLQDVKQDWLFVLAMEKQTSSRSACARLLSFVEMQVFRETCVECERLGAACPL